MSFPIDEKGEGCHKIIKTSIPDGYGGTKDGYKTGETFLAVINKKTSATAKVAEQTGYTAQYEIDIDPEMQMAAGDLWYRDRDMQIFRTVSNPDDEKTPEDFSIQFKHFDAEKTEIDPDLILD